jgi:hypothetical protein
MKNCFMSTHHPSLIAAGWLTLGVVNNITPIDQNHITQKIMPLGIIASFVVVKLATLLI